MQAWKSDFVAIYLLAFMVPVPASMCILGSIYLLFVVVVVVVVVRNRINSESMHTHVEWSVFA